jgi:hypothetical protein
MGTQGQLSDGNHWGQLCRYFNYFFNAFYYGYDNMNYVEVGRGESWSTGQEVIVTFQEVLELELSLAKDELARTKALVSMPGPISDPISVRLLEQKKHVERMERVVKAYQDAQKAGGK